jgi:hypothetical protein
VAVERPRTYCARLTKSWNRLSRARESGNVGHASVDGLAGMTVRDCALNMEMGD